MTKSLVTEIKEGNITDTRKELPGFPREDALRKSPGRKKKRFKKTSDTWRLFEHYFLTQLPEAYPILLGPYTKGQALNLAIGMNTCHVQHREDTGMPEESMLYSAKPLQQGADWWVEISVNYTRTGQTRPSRQNKPETHWLATAMATIGNYEQDALDAQIAQKKAEKPDAQEDLLASFYGTGPSPACPAIPPEAGLPEASSPSLPLSPRSKS